MVMFVNHLTVQARLPPTALGQLLGSAGQVRLEPPNQWPPPCARHPYPSPAQRQRTEATSNMRLPARPLSRWDEQLLSKARDRPPAAQPAATRLLPLRTPARSPHLQQYELEVGEHAGDGVPAWHGGPWQGSSTCGSTRHACMQKAWSLFYTISAVLA